MSSRTFVSAAFVAALVGVAPAEAATVRLHVQAPYDVANNKFDLERLEYQNIQPIFARSFLVPYETLEPLLDNMLEEVVGRQRKFLIKCWGLGVDELCPDTEIRIYLHSNFKFTQKGQPVVQSIGPATANKFRVKLDAQAKVSLDASIHHDTGIWYSGHETVDIWALIGAHAQVDITLWPQVKAENIQATLTHDGGNITIDGLSEQIIVAGTVLGGAALGPLGAALGAVFASIGAEAAEDAIKGAINDAITDQLNAANEELRGLIRSQIEPQIAQIVDYQNKALNTKLPGIGLTVAQALAIGPASIDVRSKATGDDARVVATLRFDPTGKGKSMSGLIRFPKTMCRFATGGNKMTGTVTVPIAVDPINADLAGKPCSSIIGTSTFARSTYLGESPEKLLKSGDASNNLPSWQSTGGISTSGNAVDKGDYWECPYTLNNLPAAQIIELAAVKGGELATRLDQFAFRARFLSVALGPQPLLFDSDGKPESPQALVFGGKGPKTLSDCPTSVTGGTGLNQNKLADLKDKFDPDKCPVCGLLDVFNHRDIVSNPARAVELTRIAGKADIAQQVEQTLSALTARGAIEGVQRIQAELDAGLKARALQQVAKGQALRSKQRAALKNVTFKDVAKVKANTAKVKVLDGDRALKLQRVRVDDAKLPGGTVEVLVKGKAAGK